MTDSLMAPYMTERQQLMSGIAALVLAVGCVLTLTVLQPEQMLVGVGVGLLAVAALVSGTLWVGTSDQVQV